MSDYYFFCPINIASTRPYDSLYSVFSKRKDTDSSCHIYNNILGYMWKTENIIFEGRKGLFARPVFVCKKIFTLQRCIYINFLLPIKSMNKFQLSINEE